MAKENDIHVLYISELEKWTVKEEGNDNPISGYFDTREEAKKKGREIAMKRKVELLIHRQDGTIGERSTYKYDPPESKG